MTQVATTFDSLDAVTGAVVASPPVHTAEDVRAAVGRARPAAIWWRELGYAGRAARLRAWRALLTDRLDELALLMRRENGKPRDDAIGEISVAIGHLDWAARHAVGVLGRRRVSAGLLAINHAASVEYIPYGVVGVIGPWNYPVHTPMGSISYALAAGNAVVFKPSEFTPAVGQWLAATFAEGVPEQPVFQVVTGFGETGAALCRAGVDKLAFTGSTTTGKKVMAACAETLTPVMIECGGKDALIVARDADLDAAANGAVWGGLANGGQTCAGVERVYAVDAIYEEFLAKVKHVAAGVRGGADDGAQYGPITMPGQLDVIRRHIDDAIGRGGTAIMGGPDSVAPPFVQPVLLVDVPEDSAAVREETFGPTLTIARVRDEDEAIARANDNPFGLGAAVFSAKQGERIAAALSCGMVSINSVITFAMVPEIPFGGVRDSGFGRVHGADGLREFAWPKGVTRQRLPAPIPLTTFDRPANAIRRLTTLVRARWGHSPVSRIKRARRPKGSDDE
ncbi:MAG: aldehyde dehydrogenase family protein [Actinomycetota bacterium]